MQRVDVWWILSDAQSSAVSTVLEKRESTLRAVHYEDAVSTGDLHGISWGTGILPVFFFLQPGRLPPN